MHVVQNTMTVTVVRLNDPPAVVTPDLYRLTEPNNYGVPTETITVSTSTHHVPSGFTLSRYAPADHSNCPSNCGSPCSGLGCGNHPPSYGAVSLTFTAGTESEISFDDPEIAADNALLDVRIEILGSDRTQVTDSSKGFSYLSEWLVGDLALTTTSGLQTTGGASYSTSRARLHHFRGYLADINAALNGATYRFLDHTICAHIVEVRADDMETAGRVPPDMGGKPCLEEDNTAQNLVVTQYILISYVRNLFCFVLLGLINTSRFTMVNHKPILQLPDTSLTTPYKQYYPSTSSVSSGFSIPNLKVHDTDVGGPGVFQVTVECRWTAVEMTNCVPGTSYPQGLTSSEWQRDSEGEILKVFVV